MRVNIAAWPILLFIAADARAAFTDFSDYPQFTTFHVGDTFQSNGVSFKAVSLAPISHPVWVQGALLPGPGVEFVLPPSTQEVSLRYADGAGAFIAVNGVQPNYPPPQVNYPKGFGYLSGTTLGGVQLIASVNLDNGGYQDGRFTLRGPINSLVIAGLELSLDDVFIGVPEPGAVALFATGLLALAAARRR